MSKGRSAMWRVAFAVWSPKSAGAGMDWRDAAAVLGIVMGVTWMLVVAWMFALAAVPNAEELLGTTAIVRLPLIGVAIAGASITIAIRVLVTGCLVWAVTSMMYELKSPALVVGPVVLAEVPRSYGRIMEIVLVVARRGDVESLADLVPRIGVNSFFAELPWIWNFLLQYINVFEVGAVMVVTAGLVDNMEGNVRRAALVAISCWVVIAGCSVVWRIATGASG